MTTQSHSTWVVARLLNKLWRAGKEQSGEKVDLVTQQREKKCLILSSEFNLLQIKGHLLGEQRVIAG